MLLRRRIVQAALATVLLLPLVGVDTRRVAPAGAQTAPVVTAQQVATGLDYPSMFTVAPDGRIFFAEVWSGRIGVVRPSDRATSTYFVVPEMCGVDDRGLFGLVLHPAFATNQVLYAYGGRRVADGTCHNQVLRIAPTATGMAMTVLVSIPIGGQHHGGRMLFGPDGYLYVSTGDSAGALPDAPTSRASRQGAQDTSDLRGKILRMTDTGGPAPGNPFGNLVFAYGLRNTFGFDFDPASGRLWAAENGPGPQYPGDVSGPGPHGGCNDELDLITAGANMGWGPSGTCATPPAAPVNTNQDGPTPVLPSLLIEAASGITGARFCSGCGLGTSNEGRFFWVKYSDSAYGAEIHGATLSADRTAVTSDTVVFRPPRPGALSIERGPDGALYYSDVTSIWKLTLGAPTTSFLLNATRTSDTVVGLQWSGATGSSVELWRRAGGATEFTKRATSANDGTVSDTPGAGPWDYRVCVAGTATCSNIAGAITMAGAATPASTTTTTTTTTTAPPPSTIALTLSLSSPTVVRLQWSGATSSSIDVLRRASGTGTFTKVASSSNDGNAADTPGAGTWDYKVCHAGTSTCSNTATITV